MYTVSIAHNSGNYQVHLNKFNDRNWLIEKSMYSELYLEQKTETIRD
jgi:hypothetical protein